MITVAIQAGGLSRRIGQDKALLKLAGKPLIEHILDRVEGLGDEILITANQAEAYAYLGCRVVQDPVSGAGALTGLHTALKAAQGEHILVLACDMPFIQRKLLKYMLCRADKADVIIPHRGEHYEPFHAVYARACLPAIESELASSRQRVRSFFPRVRVLGIGEEILDRMDPHGLSFFNINTLQDLARAEIMLAEGLDDLESI